MTDFVPMPYPGRAQEKLLAAAAPSIAPSCTSDKTFVDTDVLVYAHDIDHSVKRDRARAALRGLLDDGTGVVSPQVLQAFYVSVTRKIAQPPPIDEARSVVEVYAF